MKNICVVSMIITIAFFYILSANAQAKPTNKQKKKENPVLTQCINSCAEIIYNACTTMGYTNDVKNQSCGYDNQNFQQCRSGCGLSESKGAEEFSKAHVCFHGCLVNHCWKEEDRIAFQEYKNTCKSANNRYYHSACIKICKKSAK